MVVWVGSKSRPARKADNLTAICEPTVKKMREPRPLTPLWAFMACYRDSFTFFTWGVEDLSTKLRKILNGGSLLLKLLR
jgi:hypothetical protein